MSDDGSSVVSAVLEMIVCWSVDGLCWRARSLCFLVTLVVAADVSCLSIEGLEMAYSWL